MFLDALWMGAKLCLQDQVFFDVIKGLKEISFMK